MNATVLVCDDALFMRTILTDILTRGGYTVVGEAGNGEDAIEQYLRLRPDLVTMDLIMPGMGGVETVRALLRKDPDARVVVCSAMNQDALVAQALTAGAREYVVKPFQGSHVLEAAERALAATTRGPAAGRWAQ
jgi:two-component system, chemotaxis family, chemotaxis protein CheY